MLPVTLRRLKSRQLGYRRRSFSRTSDRVCRSRTSSCAGCSTNNRGEDCGSRRGQ